ncbi:MAG: hypothetical protein V1720_12250 [bacterium]
MKIICQVFFVLVFLLTLSVGVVGQDSTGGKRIFPSGFSIEYGIGSYAVTDEYISKEKYSGSLPFYEISWAKPHENYVYTLSISYQNSSEIKNNNVSTDVHQFNLNQGFNYTLPKFTIFDRDAYVFIGPAAELFFYYNKQKIAVSGFDYSQSFAMLISGCISSHLFYTLSDKLNLESSLVFSVISLGFRMVDSEEDDESPVRILTSFSGTNANFKFGARYYFLDNLSLKAAYNFHLTRISSWEPLLAASDNLIFSLTYGF